MTSAQTPERPVTWTDKELVQAWKASCMAQVLGLRECLAALGAVHPAEVREMQREAWKSGWDERDQRDKEWAIAKCKRDAACDACLPSLAPKSPPPLVLSTGTWTRDENKAWHRAGIAPIWNPSISTASDAEKLAAWLRAYGSTEEQK